MFIFLRPSNILGRSLGLSGSQATLIAGSQPKSSFLKLPGFSELMSTRVAVLVIVSSIPSIAMRFPALT